MNSRSFKFTTYKQVRDQRPASQVDEGILVDIIRDNQALIQQTAAIRAVSGQRRRSTFICTTNKPDFSIH